MILDIRRIFDNYDGPVHRTFTADFSGEDFPGYQVPEPVEGMVGAALEGRILVLTLKETAAVTAPCARCLDEVRQEFLIERTYDIREGDWLDEEAELPFTPEGRLDITELAREEILLEVPTVLLCSDDCLGLCPVCGKHRPCGCKPQQEDAVDPRLSVLKQLLTD